MKIELAVEFFSIFFYIIPYGITYVYLFCKNDLRYSKKKTIAILFILNVFEAFIHSLEDPFYFSDASVPTVPLLTSTITLLGDCAAFFIISRKNWARNMFFSFLNSIISTPVLILLLSIKNIFIPSDLNVNNISHYYELPYIILLSSIIILAIWITYKLTDKHLRKWIILSDFTLLSTYLVIYIITIFLELLTYNNITTVTAKTFAIIFLIIPCVIVVFLLVELVLLEKQLSQRKRHYLSTIQNEISPKEANSFFEQILLHGATQILCNSEPPILIKQMIYHLDRLVKQNGSRLKVHISIKNFEHLDFSEILFSIQQLFDFIQTQMSSEIPAHFTLTLVQEYEFLIVSVSGKITENTLSQNKLVQNYFKHSFYLTNCEANLRKYIRKKHGKIEFLTNDKDFIQIRFIFILNAQGKEV